jgi:hypothetical protein
MVARIVRGLQILADEIDVIERRVNQGPVSLVEPLDPEAESPIAAWSSEPGPQDEQSTKAAHTLTEQISFASPIALE